MSCTLCAHCIVGNDVLGDTSRVDKDIRSAVELNHRVDSSVNGSAVTDIHLKEGDGQAGLLVKLSSSLITQLLVGVKDDKGLSSSLSAGAGHVVAQTAGTTVN